MTQASAGLQMKGVYYFLYILHKTIFGSFYFNGHFAVLTNTAVQQRIRYYLMLEGLNYMLVAQVFWGILALDPCRNGFYDRGSASSPCTD